jgi:plasmid maintenance system antidote protein VapI
MNQNTPERTPAQIIKTAEGSSTYWEELAILDFTHEILGRMKALSWSKATLAERLDVEPAYVSKLIGGSNNFTLRTMVRLARALDTEVRFHLQPTGKQCLWIDYAIPHARRQTTVAVPHSAAINDDFTDAQILTQTPAGNNEAFLSAA